MDKFWRGFNLAIGQNAIFGEDLLWRMMNFVKFGGGLIRRKRDSDKFGEDLTWRKAQKQFFIHALKICYSIRTEENVYA